MRSGTLLLTWPVGLCDLNRDVNIIVNRCME